LISLSQVRLLEQKVENAVTKILQLQKENAELREKCALYESKTNKLAEQVSIFEADQNKIEEGLVSVLNKLNTIEDSINNTHESDYVSQKSSADETFMNSAEDSSAFSLQNNNSLEQNLSEETILTEDISSSTTTMDSGLNFDMPEIQEEPNDSPSSNFEQSENNQFDIF
jgi:predicted nuclease with TOPRIM domain